MEIKTADFVTSMLSYVPPRPVLPQIAIAGRSNVGKSSLINCLCRRKALAKTSATPGKTRMINLFLINSAFHLVDLPGYGFAKVDKEEKIRWGEMMENYFQKTGELKLTMLLVDIRHEPTEDDAQMTAYLRACSIPFIVIATKSDKLSKAQCDRSLPVICRKLQIQPWQLIPASSENGSGREEILNGIEKALTAQNG